MSLVIGFAITGIELFRSPSRHTPKFTQSNPNKTATMAASSLTPIVAARVVPFWHNLSPVAAYAKVALSVIRYFCKIRYGVYVGKNCLLAQRLLFTKPSQRSGAVRAQQAFHRCLKPKIEPHCDGAWGTVSLFFLSGAQSCFLSDALPIRVPN